jgi:hypothetical protein
VSAGRERTSFLRLSTTYLPTYAYMSAIHVTEAGWLSYEAGHGEKLHASSGRLVSISFPVQQLVLLGASCKYSTPCRDRREKVLFRFSGCQLTFFVRGLIDSDSPLCCILLYLPFLASSTFYISSVSRLIAVSPGT